MYPRSISTIVFVAALCIAQPSHPQDPISEIRSYLTASYDRGLLNGAVLVARGDSVLFADAYGMADFQNSIRNSVDTKFRIGSLTKQFTTVMILQLVEEGRINLSDNISAYLPNYRRDTGERVTIDHLLKHMSGIPSYTSQEFWREHSQTEYSRDEFISRFLSGDLEFAPDSTFRYCNSNHYLLAVIIENVTGESYASNLRERITEPLSMGNTGSGFSDPAIQGLAQGYLRRLNRYIPELYTNSSSLLGTGDMYSTPLDFFRWNRAFEPGVLLSDSTITKMFTHYHRINRFYGRGYAWDIYTIRLRDSDSLVWLASYNGQFYGNWAEITRVLEEDYLIVVMSNAGKPPVTADEIVNILHGRLYRLSVPIQDQLAGIIVDHGLDSALATYRAAKETDTTFLRRSERGINALGYDLLREEMIEESLAVFRLNTEDHPRSWNVWDSYAEALLASGDTAAAVINYRKSLERNPSNRNARLILERLQDD